MHLGIYLARPDMNAVAHTHPPTPIGVASTGKTIPPMFPDFVGLLGREIAWVPYVIPAGAEMANLVIEALRDHVSAVLANHGVVTVGYNLREAYFRTLVVDDAAKAYVAALAAGSPRKKKSRLWTTWGRKIIVARFCAVRFAPSACGEVRRIRLEPRWPASGSRVPLRS